MIEPEENTPQREQQLRLFPAPQPLLERFGADFFRRLPAQPGVYLMRGERGQLLYVGKAKNLRQRLNSYRHPAFASRKTVRLVHAVRGIDWELCASDEAAQLRENQLLRAHRPRFNRVGTWPKAYCFIVLGNAGGGLRLSLTRRSPLETANRSSDAEVRPDLVGRRGSADEGDGSHLEGRWFGAFKAGAALAFGALLRLLWQVVHQAPELNTLPRRLVLEKPPGTFAFTHQAAAEWFESLSAFLAGTSAQIVDKLAWRTPALRTCFEQQARQADLDLLEQFFVLGPYRNREAAERTRSKGLILQEELDDLHVLARVTGSIRPLHESATTRGNMSAFGKAT